MLTSGHSPWIFFLQLYSKGVAKVAMVATANQRADLALTVGLDYRRGAANAVHRERVCPRRPGQESCGRGGARRRSPARPSLEAGGEVGRHLHGRGAQPLRALLVVGRPARLRRRVPHGERGRLERRVRVVPRALGHVAPPTAECRSLVGPNRAQTRRACASVPSFYHS